MNGGDNDENLKEFDMFLDFVQNLLNIDPRKRLKASEAIEHDFVRKIKQSLDENLQDDDN